MLFHRGEHEVIVPIAIGIAEISMHSSANPDSYRIGVKLIFYFFREKAFFKF